MIDESEEHFGEICSGNLNFGRAAAAAAAIDALALDDVLAFWDSRVAAAGAERRSLVVAVSPGSDANITLRVADAPLPGDPARMELTLETLSDWRATQPLLPARRRGV